MYNQLRKGVVKRMGRDVHILDAVTMSVVPIVIINNANTPIAGIGESESVAQRCREIVQKCGVMRIVLPIEDNPNEYPLAHASMCAGFPGLRKFLPDPLIGEKTHIASEKQNCEPDEAEPFEQQNPLSQRYDAKRSNSRRKLSTKPINEQ